LDSDSDETVLRAFKIDGGWSYHTHREIPDIICARAGCRHLYLPDMGTDAQLWQSERRACSPRCTGSTNYSTVDIYSNVSISYGFSGGEFFASFEFCPYSNSMANP
tara:strand:+ start:571 stop:888 length:318 start_codon:yes stop_codon:yes gene_type:complete